MIELNHQSLFPRENRAEYSTLYSHCWFFMWPWPILKLSRTPRFMNPLISIQKTVNSDSLKNSIGGTRNKDLFFFFLLYHIFHAPLTLGLVIWLSSNEEIWVRVTLCLLQVQHLRWNLCFCSSLQLLSSITRTPSPSEWLLPECSFPDVPRIWVAGQTWGQIAAWSKRSWARQSHTQFTDLWVSNRCLYH